MRDIANLQKQGAPVGGWVWLARIAGSSGGPKISAGQMALKNQTKLRLVAER
jgi:hypothetical protein